MKNKFLEYLLNNKLKDITYHLRDIDTEKEKIYSNKLEEYPYVDDLFKLLFELNVSQEEIFNSIREEKASFSLADILFGYEMQNDKNKKEKFKTFNPLIENNVNFYKQLIRVALSEHKNIKEVFKKEHEELFNYLIDIGIKKNFFQVFTEVEKQTQIPEYKKILIEKGVFNINYKLEETIQLLDEKNESKIVNHFSMYSNEIYKLLETIDVDSFKELKVKMINLLKIKEDNQDIEINKYFNRLIFNLIKVEKENFSPLFKNKIIKENVVSVEKYSNRAFSELMTHPKLLENLLNNCESFEKEKLFKKEKYNSGLIINHFTETSKDKLYLDIKLLSLILENIDYYVLDNDEEKKSTVISHILFHQETKIEDKEFINKIFDKYHKNIVKSLSTISDTENYFKYEQQMLKFNDSKKSLDSSIWGKIKSKLEIVEKDNLYKFNNKYKENRLSYDNRLNHENQISINHLISYINLTQDVGVLNVLNADQKNPEWKNINIDFNIDKKYYSGENLIIYLLRKVSSEETKLEIINWVINESIENFYDLKFATKDILSHYQKIEANNKNHTIFTKLVNMILEKESSFEFLIRNNKSKFKLINTIDDELIKKRLSYYALKNKLNNIQVESIVDTSRFKNKI